MELQCIVDQTIDLITPVREIVIKLFILNESYTDSKKRSNMNYVAPAHVTLN